MQDIPKKHKKQPFKYFLGMEKYILLSIKYILLKNNELTQFAKNIRFLRKKKGLTQKNVADEFGLANATTYGRYETGNNEPNMQILVKMGDLFNKPIRDLIMKDLTQPQVPSGASGGVEEPTADYGGISHWQKEYIKTKAELKTLLYQCTLMDDVLKSKTETIDSQKDTIEAQKQLIDKLKV